MDREELENLFEQFVSEKYPSRELEMYADYRDELSDDQACEIVSFRAPMEAFYEMIDEGYLEARWQYEDDIESEFESWCADNGYEYESGELNANDIQIYESSNGVRYSIVPYSRSKTDDLYDYVVYKGIEAPVMYDADTPKAVHRLRKAFDPYLDDDGNIIKDMVIHNIKIYLQLNQYLFP